MKNISVKQLLELSQSEPSVVTKDATVGEVVEMLIEDRATHEVYVVNGDGHCCGAIPLRRLAHYVFLHEMPDKSSATDLLEMISVENAGDLCLQEPIFVHEDDTLEQLLNAMFTFDVNEIAVVDPNERIVGSINMIDLVQAWHEGRLEGLKP
jgi:Mg/Co/Ni transporter MgtE